MFFLFFIILTHSVDIFKAGQSWQLQINGDTIDTSFDVDVYDVDLFDTTDSDMNTLRADGRIIVCYFSAGSWEDWRDDADDFPEEVKGSNLDGWPGEKWLDITNLDVLKPIMSARISHAAERKCDAVDPDNVDGYTQNSGFTITADDQLVYNKWLSEEAHRQGLNVGLKNSAEQVEDLVDYFDFVVVEECSDWNECDMYCPFVAQNKPVLSVEYPSSKDPDFCPAANEMGLSTIRKDYDLSPTPYLSCFENDPDSINSPSEYTCGVAYTCHQGCGFYGYCSGSNNCTCNEGWFGSSCSDDTQLENTGIRLKCSTLWVALFFLLNWIIFQKY